MTSRQEDNTRKSKIPRPVFSVFKSNRGRSSLSLRLSNNQSNLQSQSNTTRQANLTKKLIPSRKKDAVRKKDSVTSGNVLPTTWSVADAEASTSASLNTTLVCKKTISNEQALNPNKKHCFDVDVKSKESYELALLADIAKYMLQKEQTQLLTRDPKIEILDRTRLVDGLVSLLRTKFIFNHERIIPIAVNLMDRTFSAKTIAADKQMAVASACYWIAAKMVGTEVPASFIVSQSEGAFTGADLCAAELLLMKELCYPSMPVTTDDYAAHLIRCSGEEDPELLMAAMSFLGCVSLLDLKLSLLPPSTLAVAVLLAASQLLFRSQTLLRLQTCSVYRDVERREKKLEEHVKMVVHVLDRTDEMTRSVCYGLLSSNKPLLPSFLKTSAFSYCFIHK